MVSGKSPAGDPLGGSSGNVGERAGGGARGRGVAFMAGALVLFTVLDFTLERIVPDSSIRQLLLLAACNVLVALSLNVINGMAGQFSIGHAGFLGLGGYTSAVVSSHLHEALGGGDPTFARSFIVVPVALVASALIAGAFGYLVGLPSLRLKGDYLAIVTLGFAEIVRLLIATAQLGEKQTVGEAFAQVGGPKGVVGPFVHALSVAITSLGGQNGYAGPKNQGVPLYAGPFWIFGLALVLGILAYRLKFSGWGRALRALREDEIAAAAVGVDPTRYKVRSFVIAAVGAGIAGGLMAMNRDGTPTVQPDNYNFAASFDAITMVILGGSGSVTGAAIGGVFITFTIKAIEAVQSTNVIQSLKRSASWLDLNALRMIIYAGVLIALMIWRPEGLLGEREIFEKKRAPKPRSAPPDAPPGGARSDTP
ncbi:MAG TPA: branched-chain amino acid ABC transporter permease [Polyangiaceae bacterium]|nr:branched-chain amino acid ABC transporter permease [Polyangiaceae bacterium]